MAVPGEHPSAQVVLEVAGILVVYWYGDLQIGYFNSDSG